MTRRHPGSAGARRGQALVEFALVLPVFLLMLFGTIDAGRLVYLNSTVAQAAREGARVASVEASWVGSTDPSCGQPYGAVCPADVNALRTDVTDASNRMMTPFGSVQQVYSSCDPSTGSPPTGQWTTTTCTSRKTGSTVSIRVTDTFTAITPIVSNILGTLNLSGSATMVIN